jgi:hypothetical protein
MEYSMGHGIAQNLVNMVAYRKRIGDMYRDLGLHAEAEKHYSRATVLTKEIEELIAGVSL